MTAGSLCGTGAWRQLPPRLVVAPPGMAVGWLGGGGVGDEDRPEGPPEHEPAASRGPAAAPERGFPQPHLLGPRVDRGPARAEGVPSRRIGGPAATVIGAGRTGQGLAQEHGLTSQGPAARGMPAENSPGPGGRDGGGRSAGADAGAPGAHGRARGAELRRGAPCHGTVPARRRERVGAASDERRRAAVVAGGSADRLASEAVRKPLVTREIWVEGLPGIRLVAAGQTSGGRLRGSPGSRSGG